MKQKAEKGKDKQKIESSALRGLEQRYLHEEGGKLRIRFYVPKIGNYRKRMEDLTRFVVGASISYEGKPINLQMISRDYEPNPSQIEVNIIMHYTIGGMRSHGINQILKRAGQSLVKKIEGIVA